MKENVVHKIAVISDTHGLLRPEIKEILKGCQVIFHGGDMNSWKILEKLKEIAPVYAVRGNGDKEWAREFPQELKVTMFGLRIYMVHNKKHKKADLHDVDLFIYGHSHKYEEKEEDGVYWLNPGSCGPRRFRLPVTMAVVTVEEDTGSFQVEKIDLTEGVSKPSVLGVSEGNLKHTLEIIIKEMKAGRKVEYIAEHLGVEREFVEQVLRIYVTHPGVDAQGIMDKMEVSALFDRPGENIL